jgi:uncharacterized protein YjiS (DUF1127 family)
VADFLPKLGHRLTGGLFSRCLCAAPLRSGGLIIEVALCLRRWLRARETARRLNALSDRELSDIGIARHDIARVAR